MVAIAPTSFVIYLPFIRFLYFKLVWGYCFIHSKAMREARLQGKTYIVPTPFLFIITALPEGTGERNCQQIMKHLLYGLIILSMVACTSKKNSYTQEQLYEQTSSGVVLIQNTYYYKITLSNNGFYSTNYVFSKLQDGELKNISHTISNNMQT